MSDDKDHDKEDEEPRDDDVEVEDLEVPEGTAENVEGGKAIMPTYTYCP
jgi:hypothetical protein